MQYDQAIDILLERFYGFANSKELKEGYDLDLPYLVYAGFAEYFKKLVNESKNPEQDSEVIEICHFLDEMAGSADMKILDLLVAGFFESLDWVTDEAKLPVMILKKLLDDRTCAYLIKLIEWKPS